MGGEESGGHTPHTCYIYIYDSPEKEKTSANHYWRTRASFSCRPRYAGRRGASPEVSNTLTSRSGVITASPAPDSQPTRFRLRSARPRGCERRQGHDKGRRTRQAQERKHARTRPTSRDSTLAQGRRPVTDGRAVIRADDRRPTDLWRRRRLWGRRRQRVAQRKMLRTSVGEYRTRGLESSLDHFVRLLQ